MAFRTPEATIYNQAMALSAFTKLTRVGALHIYRHEPETLEGEIRKAAGEGVAAAERFLKERA